MIRYLSLGIGIGGVALMGITGTFRHTIAESRWWLDITRQTPVRDVIMTGIKIADRQCFVIDLVKVRCEPVRFSVITQSRDGLRERAEIETAGARPVQPIDIPASSDLIRLGPLCVVPKSLPAVTAEFYGTYRCPDRTAPLPILIGQVTWPETP